MSENVCVKHKRGWSDEGIQYGFEIFPNKDVLKLKGQYVICTIIIFEALEEVWSWPISAEL